MSEEWKSKGLPFELNMPIGVWLNKSAPPGKQRRIGGLLTTDSLDRQGERVIQKGLDFSHFMTHGWFNDNHSRATAAIVGYPEKGTLKFFKKGEALPDGRNAPANGHWAEGYLLSSKRADEIWDTATALSKAGDDRRLGFSIEGGVQRRMGTGNKVIAKATVNNVAITNCPVNTDSYMQTLAKSLVAVGDCTSPDDLWKALTAGDSVDVPEGPVTGEGAGRVLTPESLEDEERLDEAKKCKKVSKADTAPKMPAPKDEKQEDEDENGKDEDEESMDEENEGEEEQAKALTPDRAWELARARFPGITAKQVGKLVRVARLLKGRSAF